MSWRAVNYASVLLPFSHSSHQTTVNSLSFDLLTASHELVNEISLIALKVLVTCI